MTVPLLIDSAGTRLAGDLVVPGDAKGVVVFAHGSGSSRHSQRNRAVAEILQDNGFATLLLDLLTEQEDRDGDLRFDIPLLAGRVVCAIDQVGEQVVVRGLPIGLFGASTGAAAALIAAARRTSVRAVVSRGGRPDLAGPALTEVRAPTLLIVGGRDDVVLELNRSAQKELSCTNRLVVVPGAGHLFEEPGTLDAVANLAAEWFATHLAEHG